MTNRRSFLLGIGAALAAPAIVRAESIMKVASLRQRINWFASPDLTDTIVIQEVTKESGRLVAVGSQTFARFVRVNEIWQREEISEQQFGAFMGEQRA